MCGTRLKITKMKINYIHEPTDLQCGQAVLAMLIGTSAEAICQIIGNDRETTLREMKDTLRNFGFTVSDARVPVKYKHELPPLCMLSLETPRLKGTLFQSETLSALAQAPCAPSRATVLPLFSPGPCAVSQSASLCLSVL